MTPTPNQPPTTPAQTPEPLQGMMAGFMLFSIFIMPKLKVDPEVRGAALVPCSNTADPACILCYAGGFG